MKTSGLFFFVFLLFISVFDCGVGDSSSLLVSSQKVLYDNQHSIALDFSSGDYLQFDMSGDNLVGKSLYLVKSNGSSHDISSIDTGKVVIFDGKALSCRGTTVQGSGSTMRYFSPDDFSLASQFNNNPPPFVAASSPRGGSVYHYGEDNFDLVEGDVTRDYWVCNNSNWEKQTAVLIKKGYYAYVWVSQSVYDNLSVSDADNLVNYDQINDFCGIFDGSSDCDHNDGIYKLVSNVFGVEYGGGDLGDGGIDSDQHISILIYDINNDAPSNFGVAGYFWGKDLYDEDHSNKCEMLYLDSYFFDRYSKMILSVTAHELQHLIHFNMKFIKNGLISAEWYNEMCSLLCEDLISDKLGLNDSTEDSPKKFLSKFNSYYYTNGITGWVGGNEMGECSAISYTFGAFLGRNYGGASIFSEILHNSFTDKESINAALSSLGYNEDFSMVFEKFAKAIVLNDTTLDSLTFVPATSEVNSIEYNLSGFDLYNIGQDCDPEKLGPLYFLPNEQVGLKSFGVSVHSCKEWQGLGNSISIMLEKPKEKIKFYLLVK